MCGAMAGMPQKPTPDQLAGFGQGTGTGVKIVGYNPNYGDKDAFIRQRAAEINKGKVDDAALLRAESLVPKADQGGMFVLSDGTTRKAADVLAENQRNAYGSNMGYLEGLDRAQSARVFIGKELVAPKAAAQPAPAASSTPVVAPAPAAAASAATVSAEPEYVPQEQTKDGVKSKVKRTEGQRRTASDTLVTGGEGVLGKSTGGAKELLGA